jgi:pyruvate/2-oxoacid:ferredoxin oxidoreductase beta subunit
MGGDGWARYWIRWIRPLLKRRNVNLLVLDTEVYSNIASIKTPRAVVAKFAAGKTTARKDLGMLALSYEMFMLQELRLAPVIRKQCAFIEAE